MKIVIDTNLIASAVFFGGKPREVLEMVLKKAVTSFVTTEIIEEYEETFEYLIAKYPSKPVKLPLNHIISACQIIDSKSNVKVCRDPDDDKFISCALDAKCMFIVSGDKDLLSVKEYDGVEIITVAEFLDRRIGDCPSNLNW